jgi:chromatin remodeling complex protein RSC6
MATKKKGGAKKKAGKKVSAKKASARKGAKKTAAKKAARKPAKKAGPKKKRAPNPAFMKPMMPDETLGAVVGNGGMPRTEITKRLWAYIKRNGLQDSKNRRMINADEKMQKLFGGKKQVSMFEMTKLASKHLK